MSVERYITLVEDEGLREILEMLQDEIKSLKERVEELEKGPIHD